MAVIETNLTPTPMIFPWRGITDISRERSEVPRAEIRWSEVNTDITDGAAADNQGMSIAATLPANFAYVILDLFASITQTVAGASNSWDQQAFMSVNDDNSGVADSYNIPVSLASPGITSDNSGNQREVVCYVASQLPRIVILPREGATASISSIFINPTVNEADFTVRYFLRVAQYDVTQAYHWAVNTPTLTR